MAFRKTFVAAAALAAATTTFVDSAEACGGLFCNSAQPVNQAAERIIFSKNDDGTVTAAIEIMYEGPGMEFAWVLPVPPGDTQVGVSSSIALDRLEAQSNPQYRLNVSFDESCSVDFNQGTAANGGLVAPPSAADPTDAAAEGPGIMVVQEGNAGPYDWVQIEVPPELDDPADAAVMWLTDNGFDIDGIGPAVLREYLEDGMNLIAFKLQKGKTDGAIRPIMLTYESERPFIPIQPTAVAANEDMGMKIWVLGDSRAIPNNYRHLELNEALIDWFAPGTVYDDVVIAAANEAGGKGFVTEQSGPAGQFTEAIYSEFEQQNWENLRTGRFETLAAFFQTAQNLFAGYDGFNDVMMDPEVIPLREGATHEQFLSCISCYFETNVAVRNEAYPETPYVAGEDPIEGAGVVTTFLAEFERLVIAPMEDTRAMFEDNSSVTRFYTTMSPDEMTRDPDFDFNPELPDIDNQHVAEQLMLCNADTEWEIELPQGQIVRGDGRTWPITLDSDFPVNLRIVQLSTEGEGETIEDNAGKIALMLTDLDLGEGTPKLMDPDKGGASTVDPDDGDPTSSDDGPDDGNSERSDSGGGCGCATVRSSKANLGWLGLLGLPVLLRRRRK